MHDLVDSHIAELTRCMFRLQELESEHESLVGKIQRLQLLVSQDQSRFRLDVQRSAKDSGDGV